MTADSPASTSPPRLDIERPDVVRRWLWALVGLVVFLVLVGGFTRLSRAGLSIVEWDVVTGVIPPRGQAAWDQAFAAYRASPEGRTVNAEISMSEFQRIFLIEWAHRLIARLAGLFVVIPLAVFLVRGIIPWRRSGPYLAIGALFAFQGFLGWFMVASGLVDRPSVSHLRLTAHFMAALVLLALAMWTALELGRRQRAAAARSSAALPLATGGRDGALERRSAPSWVRGLTLGLLALVVLQVAYGALMAGLKAGWIANTWPLMFGQLVPEGLLSELEPAWRNVIDAPATVHFIHRWGAIVVLLAAELLRQRLRRLPGRQRAANLAAVLVAVTVLQVLLGIATVMLRVAMPVALLHQLTGVAVFGLSIALVHAVWRR